MPPEYRCTICGNTVSKRKSYAHDGGRACKHHEEAAEATQARLDKEQADREAKAKAEKKKHRYEFGLGTPQQDPIWCRTHCWICECEGFTPEEIPMRMLIALQKRQQAGDFNFLDMDAQRKAAGFDEKPGLIDFKLEDEAVSLAVHERCEKHTRPLLEFLNVARLCGACAQKAGIDVRKTMEDRVPKVPNLKTLYLLGAIYEGSELADNVKTIAATENLEAGAATENLEAGVAIEESVKILADRLKREAPSDECLVDSDGNLIDNDGDAETDME